MNFKKLGWLSLMLITLGASAQVATSPDWKESEAPPPPSFDQHQLIPIDMPRYVSLQFGVDPATLSLTPDGIVRYVVVTVNASGSVSAMYEGIRCSTWEVKTYARYTASGQWSTLNNPPWLGLSDNVPSKHAAALAKQGLCDSGSTTWNSLSDMVQALKK